MPLLLRFLKNQAGVTAIEYAIIAGCVCVGLLASFNAIGSNVNSKFVPVSNGLN